VKRTGAASALEAEFESLESAFLAAPAPARASRHGHQRIEPRNSQGEVYVTDAFAALLSPEPEVRFAAE